MTGLLEPRESEIIDNLGEDNDEVIPYRYSITSYGADYPVDAIVRRMSDGSIYIPSFQRGYVWSFRQASRFVESLLLGLPVPGIFLSKEEKTQRLLVIDGQQRLRTLQYFYKGRLEPLDKPFSLKGVQTRYENASINTLSDDDRRRLDDSILHATIVRQDEPSDDDSSIYHVFERLNTSGTQLLPQEIRACIYHGPFNDLLRDLNQNKSWRAIYGPPSTRMRDQELILRVLALYYEGESYSKPMKEFLNRFMGRNRSLNSRVPDEIRKPFDLAIEVIHRFIGPRAFKPKRALNAAVVDAVMVGIAKRLQEETKIRDRAMLKTRYEALMCNDSFLAATETGTADEESVRRRLKLATEAFADVR